MMCKLPMPSPSRSANAGVVKRGGTTARKHARNAVDDARLIRDKHRDDMLLDALVQRLGPVDIDVVDFFGAPKLHEPCLHLKVHTGHAANSASMLHTSRKETS